MIYSQRPRDVLGIRPNIRRVFQSRDERQQRINEALDNGYRWCPCGCGALLR